MKGFVGPLHITPRGQLQHAQGQDLLQQHIATALLTRAAWHRTHTQAEGERLLRPEFGCRLHHMLHEPLTEETVALMEALLVEDLQRSLPHLTLTHIHSQLEEQQGTVHIAVGFATETGQQIGQELHIDSKGVSLDNT